MQSQQSLLDMASRAVAFAGLLIVTGVARAQWTAVYLHPAGATQSYANGGSGTTQVGSATIGGKSHACRWSGTAASWVDLNPPGSVSSAAYAMSGTQVGGWAWGTTAALWSGTPASAIALGGATVYGTSGTHQVGYYVVSSAGYVFHALLWSGTAASGVDLNPGSAVSSFAYGISGTQQVGEASSWEDSAHAGLWNGTAASWVDLGYGKAFATSGTQQVGIAGSHAALWSGTAASLVDLNPAVATSSSANSIFGTYQVGYVTLSSSSGSTNASLWSGTAASWEDLSLALTGSWSNTVAQSVWSDGTRLYVAGSGYNNSANRNEALLWSRAPVAPDLDADGDVDNDDLALLKSCKTRDGVPHNGTPLCQRADFNHDGDVDQSDFGVFQRCYSGQNHPGNQNCAN